ncbi:flagellar hook-length control protein FliK [Clostridium mediterraneense]|uniref:flagellar hook-length control protein FliK n=1 Tax=Clostridium mediterraneense TaxID=1805472 RepID=UPI0008344EB8|nr:flagellar hook-length control protein FliK [Clostridium mediterraneense]
MEIGLKNIDITKFLEKNNPEKKTSNKEGENFASVLEAKSNQDLKELRNSKELVCNQDDYEKAEKIEHNKINKESKEELIEDNYEENLESSILLLSLFISNNNQDINTVNIDFSNLEYDINLIKDIKSYILSDKFDIGEFKNFLGDILTSINIKNNNLVDLKDSKLNNFFSNFIKEIKEFNEFESMDDNLSEKLAIKEVLSKLLNEDKDISVDLEVLREKFNIIKENFTTESNKTNIVQAESMVNLDEMNIETNFNLDSKNLSQENNKEELSKEDKFLSKLISSENQNRFDLNLQRIQNFSKLSETNNEISVNKFTINSDIKNMINHMSLNNIKELIVKVNPGNLGEIAVKLITEGEKMKAVINISEKETYALINSSDIKQHLSNENIKISEVEISLYKDDTSFFNEKEKFTDERNNKNQATKNEFIELNEELEKEMDITSLNIMV